MSIRTKLLSGRNINTDSDFSKYIETVSEPGVIEGLEVSTNSVAIGKCWVPCERTNGETIYSLVENFSALTIDTSGTGYVVVKIGQTYIDDGSLINEDGTGVATIEVVAELPTKNYLELASITSGVITDSRNMIKKVGELNTAIESLSSEINDLDDRVEALEKAGAINHLEDNFIVGEKYALSNVLFKQEAPTLTNSTGEDCHVGDTTGNTEIHIQRISNGTEFNKIKLNAKFVGSPTTNLKVEVRKGIKVDVSTTEAYWYGDEENILATGSVNYTEFSTTFAEVEFTLDNSVEQAEGTLLDIVVYQESGGVKIVNASNYFITGADITQTSECFSYVSVNGETRARSNLAIYCYGDGFCDNLLSKINSNGIKRGREVFGFPKEVKGIGEVGFIITYGIIRTTYYGEDVYISTSGALSNSKTNLFTYLGKTNKYGDVLFDGLVKDKIPETDGGFLKFCQGYGTAHSGSGNYTMKGYGFGKWWTKTDNGVDLPSVTVNGVRINSNGYNTSYFRLTEGFVTLSPGDTTTNMSVTDYY